MGRWGVVGLAVWLAGCEQEASLLNHGPCDPARVGHVESFGYYWGFSHPEELAPYSNTLWGFPEDAPRAVALGMKAVVQLDPVLRVTEPGRPSDAEVEQDWRTTADALRPMLGSIRALYVSDEPYWFGHLKGVPLEEVARRLDHAAVIIRATPGFEHVPLALIFASPELDWMASGAARNPLGYAWIGFDLYATPPSVLEERAVLFESLRRPEQRVIVVPDAALFADQPQDHVAALEERIAFWLAWIERHPEVIAVTPFIYRTSPGYWTGARDLPTVRARFEQIGSCVGEAVAAARAAQAP